MKYQFVKGTTSQTALIFIYDSSVTTGAGLTGLVYNSGSLTAFYYREGAGTGGTSITLATQTIGTWATGGFIELDATDMPGWYEIGIPDAALASGADFVGIQFKGAANMSPVNLEIQLTSVDLNDSTRMGLAAIPNVASGSAGGLPVDTDGNGAVRVVDGTGAREINTASGVVEANVVEYDAVSGTSTSGVPEVNLAQWVGVAPLALVSQRVQTLVAAMGAGVVTAAAVATDAIDADALAADGVAEIVADIMTEIVETEGSYTVQQALSILLSVLAGVTSSNGNTLKTPNGVGTRVAATTDASNNRTAMTLTPSS